MTELERRLRAALRETTLKLPRPRCRLDLPLDPDRVLGDALARHLRPAAVLAPVIRRSSDLSLLLTVRSQALRSHKGQISFPGGGSDAQDADAVATALREAQEEIGLAPAQVEVLGFLDDYPTISRYLVTPVVGLIDGEPELMPDEREVAGVFEVPLAHALDLAHFQRRYFTREGLNLPFYELPWKAYRIWGATAGMLHDLATKVARA